MSENSPEPDELILRDHLALDRTRLANERTVLSYVRTSLMLIVAGATATDFVGDSRSVVVTSWALMITGVVIGIFGLWRFVTMRQKINQRYTQQ